MANPVLTTSQYVEPDVYVGEILNPEASNLSADARVPAIIAKGDRLAVAKNLGIIRAFIYGERLNFSPSPPFIAALQHIARGDIALPNRVFKQDGTQVRSDQWQYMTDNSGNFVSIQIRDEAFDPTATYFADYQSVDRSVLDELPVSEIRLIRAVGNQLDRVQFIEYRDYYVPVEVTEVTPDPNNVHPTTSISAVTPTLQPGSTGTVVVDPAAQYLLNYSRSYTIVCTAITGSTPTRTATFEWSADLLSGGNDAQPPVPLHSSDVKPSVTHYELSSAEIKIKFQTKLKKLSQGNNI